MAGQVYYSDVEEGMELPAKSWGPIESSHIVRFSAAVENYEKLHHDYRWCADRGFPDVLINGPFKQGLLGSYMAQWVGDGGFLKKLSCSHRGMDLPGHVLTAKGKVTKKYIKDGLGYVECEVQLENQKGEVTCPSQAVAILPQKGGAPVPIEYPVPKGLEWYRA